MFRQIGYSLLRSFTEIDDTTICWIRIGFIAFLGIYSFGVVDSIIHNKFDAMSVATGMAALLAGGGAGISIKTKTEVK